MAAKKSASTATKKSPKTQVSSVIPQKKMAPTKSKASSLSPKAEEATSSVEKKKAFFGDFIGTFPMRKNSNDKKLENKKQPIGPVFPRGDYKIGVRKHVLGDVFVQEFNSTFLSKHIDDKLEYKRFHVDIETIAPASDLLVEAKLLPTFSLCSKELIDALIAKNVDVVLLNMKDIPLDLPEGITLAAALRREDSRDAMITRSTYGAVQELPARAKVGVSSKRRIMQIRSIRPDIEIVPLVGSVDERIDSLESENLDAVFCAWATLRRLNISPRYYVALQPDQIIPAACQGGVGILCREEDKDLASKLRYVEDSEASWSARCERAFLAKLGNTRDVPVGVFAHRKGTQDPWILDAVIGDPRTGEVLRHREIGTSRCKPESLADKAFVGILSKGARKFLPFS